MPISYFKSYVQFLSKYIKLPLRRIQGYKPKVQFLSRNVDAVVIINPIRFTKNKIYYDNYY